MGRSWSLPAAFLAPTGRAKLCVAAGFALPLAQHAADTMNEEHVPHVPREAAEPLLYKVRGVPEMGLCEGGDNHKITI